MNLPSGEDLRREALLGTLALVAALALVTVIEAVDGNPVPGTTQAGIGFGALVLGSWIVLGKLERRLRRGGLGG